ncbi:MAG: RNA polymerase sigma factor (sigma-70 family) [Kiritimatiellia bacterium]|jgi:RNA polymerase sigma factor (sigma-70 family)
MEKQHTRDQLEALHAEAFAWAMHCSAGRREQAEDLLQAVYLKVLQGKANYGGKSTFKTWLFSVIRLTAADDRRKHALRRLGLLRYQPHAQLTAIPSASPGQQALRQETHADLHQALASLSKRQREVLHLVFYQDLTIEQAAQVMQISIGSARQHYQRAKQHMRAHLTREAESNEH